MVHSTPLRVSIYGHWDDHAVDEIIFVTLLKGNTLHHTDLRWLEGKNDLTWLDLNNYVTWLEEKNSNDLTWLATRVLLTWLDLWLEQGWLVTTLISVVAILTPEVAMSATRLPAFLDAVSGEPAADGFACTGQSVHLFSKFGLQTNVCHVISHFNSHIIKRVLYTWLFSRWFYFRKFCESVLVKISTSIYGYL